MDVQTTAWQPEQAAGIASQDADTLPVMPLGSADRLIPDRDLWDLWPVRTAEGEVARFGDAAWWMALSAPAVGHPGGRHDLARLRLLEVNDGVWTDRGDVLPTGFGPGSRQWAGSAWLVDDRLLLFYTAAGQKGVQGGFQQRIVGTATTVRHGEPGEWSEPVDVVRPDPRWYQPADEVTGAAGFIKAFRDPFRFVDPRTQETYLIFTASLAGSTTDFDGAVGIARRRGDDLDEWECLPPLLTSDAVNNELERPHVVVHDGRYHLFVSTQGRTFVPGTEGRNGLYGWVADTITGPWTPLNGTGLVVANPAEEPFQAYSWLVLPDLSVSSFVDSYGLEGRHPAEVDEEGPDAARRHFGGTLAPAFHIWIDGDRAGLDRG